MVFLIQALISIIRSPRVKQVKPFTLHCSLLFFVFAYALSGGLIFNRLEAEPTREHQRREWEKKQECVLEALQRGKEPLGEPYWPVNATANTVLQCFRTEPDARSQWGLITATLYGFGIVTTLGYNRIAPITLAGRLFCVFYGICGIPMTMIIIANIGQYLNQFAGATRKNIEAYRERRRRSRLSITGEDIPESSIELMSLGLLAAFLLYVCFGAVLLPLLNGTFDFYNGIYFNFLCLTAIDFGQLVPSRWAFLPITFLYVCIGLAITTIAIDIGSEYMKKLHHFGKRMKNVATTKIWFGGKTLRVRDLLHAVGKKCGIDPSEIDKIDLENIVERTIALNEGREPPPDTNEEALPPMEPGPPERNSLLDQPPPPPKKPPHPSPPPPMVRAEQQFVGGPPVEKAVPLEQADGGGGRELNLDLCKFVAIDMEEIPAPAQEQTLAWMEPPKLLIYPRHELIEPDPDWVASPTQLNAQTPPRVIVDDGTQRMVTTTTAAEPRRFKEKKEKYGRNAKKLYETYQEEWDRLEKLSDRKLGPRRRSVLALNTLGRGGRESSLDGHHQSASHSPVSHHRVPGGSHPRPSLAPSLSSHLASSECSVDNPASPGQIRKHDMSPPAPRSGEPVRIVSQPEPPISLPSSPPKSDPSAPVAGMSNVSNTESAPNSMTPATTSISTVSRPEQNSSIAANSTFQPASNNSSTPQKVSLPAPNSPVSPTPRIKTPPAPGSAASQFNFTTTCAASATPAKLPPRGSSSRASASPRVLRPPSPRAELKNRRSSSPRKLSMTKFKKFGEVVTHPVIPGAGEPSAQTEESGEEQRSGRAGGN